MVNRAAGIFDYTNNGDGATSDSFVMTDAANAEFIVNVSIAAPTSSIVVMPTALSGLQAGALFSQQLSATDGTAPYTFALYSGSPPPGVSLSGDTLSGIPTRRGSYSFAVEVTDGTGATQIKSYSGLVASPNLTVTPTSAQAEIGKQFSLTFTSSGGIEPYSAELSPAPDNGIPPGLSLGGAEGLTLSGTPTALGTYSFKILVLDSSTGNGQFGQFFPVTITVVAPSVDLAPASGTTLTAGTVGSVYNDASISATGGVGAITYSATGLPDGLDIDAGTGAITGTPMADGTFNAVTVTATAATSGSASATYTIVVAPAPLPVVLTPATGTTLTAGTVGAAYSDSLISATGGVGAITYSATGLPAGLDIDAGTGAITGTPTADGTFSAVQVIATAATSGSASATYTIVVAPAALSATLANDSYTMTQGGILIAFGGPGDPTPNLLANDTIPTGLNFDVQFNAGGTAGSINDYGNGKFDYTPPTAFFGIDSFQYRLAYTLTPGYSNIATATIRVEPKEPVVSATSPASGPMAGNTSVTITGSNFLGATGVSFGGVPATSFTVNSDTSITAVTPAGSAGQVEVAVTKTNSGAGMSVSGSAMSFTYEALPQLGVNDVSQLEGNAGTTTFTFTISLDQPAGPGGVTYDIATADGTATADSDYVSNSLTGQTIAAGSSTGSFSVIVNGDMTFEPNETFYVNISNVSGATLADGQGTGTINNDDAAAPVTLTPATGTTLTAGTVGTAYNDASISATGGVGAITFSATGLPGGLDIDAGTGAITGTPTADGTFNAVTVTATAATSGSASATYTIVVAPAPLPVVLTPATGTMLTAGTVGAAYNDASISATGGVGTITYSATGLPGGLDIDVGTGAITGTPTADGTFNAVTVTATAATSGSATATYTIVVAPAPTPVVLTPATGTTLTAGTVAAVYSDSSISATGGVGAITYSATGLPPGLDIDVGTGAITGTPTADGTFNAVTVTATAATSGSASATYTIVIALAPPTVAGISPASGPSAGGTSVTITGTGFTGATSVTFDGVSATGVTVVDDTTITATTPAHAAGAVTVVVTAPGGTASLPNGFTYVIPAPALSSVTPNSGPEAGGTTITLTGDHLTGTTAVTVGGVAATSVTVVSDTQVTAITPTGTASTVDIALTTAGGTATLQAAYTYIAPTFVFSPPSGAIPEGTAGVEYVLAVSVTGGARPYRFSASGLPEDMGIDPGTGSLYGLPTTPGTYTITVTVRDRNGLTGSVTYILRLGGIYRPDPSKDAEVIGLINAQAQAAQRFATTQIDNFNDRLERLHNDRSRQEQSLNIRMGVTQDTNEAERMAYAQENGIDDPAGRAMGLPQAGGARPTAGAPRPVDALFGDTAFWTGGFVNFGTSDRGNIDLGHTLVGVSGGVDYRFTPDFVAGIGFGYGRDKTDIGSNGTESTGQAFSAAIYGSYHPLPFYLDGLLGVSRLDFDSTRFVTTTGDFANGKRDGTQVFGSLSAGYEHQDDNFLLSPYGRIEAAFTQLDGFTETGAGPYSLTFGSQSFDMLAGVVGLRAEYAMPMDWGVLKTRGRLEYTHDFAGSSQASIGYADLGTLPYTLDLDSYMRDYLTVGLGVDARLDNDMTLSFDYQTAFGFDGSAQNHTFGIRIGGNF